MAPEQAKVFVVEDDIRWQGMIEKILALEGHQVVLSATNIEDALVAADRLTELGVQVVTIDGNLNEDDSSGDDGRSVLAAIRKAAPQVKTIGLSGNKIGGVDVDLGKINCADLAKIVTEI